MQSTRCLSQKDVHVRHLFGSVLHDAFDLSSAPVFIDPDQLLYTCLWTIKTYVVYTFICLFSPFILFLYVL